MCYLTTEQLQLQCNVSESSLGAWIHSQKQGACARGALTQTEGRCACLEKLLLAGLSGTRGSHSFTFGPEVDAQLDQKPLEGIMRKLLQCVLKLIQSSAKIKVLPRKVTAEPGTAEPGTPRQLCGAGDSL